MYKCTIKIDSEAKLEALIKKVHNASNLPNDKRFNDYVAQKCLDIVNQVSNQRIYSHNTTNQDMRQEYLKNNKLQKFSDGFIIYNDTSIPYEKDGYNGYFSIALAFEYGVGIIGEANPIDGHWQYDVHQRVVNFEDKEIRGWWLSKTKNGSNPYIAEVGNSVITQGYQGMEIYRFAREEIIAQLPKITSDYLRSYGGIRT